MKCIVVAAIGVFALVASVHAAEPSERLESFLKRCEASLAFRLGNIQSSIAGYEQEVAEAQLQLDACRKGVVSQRGGQKTKDGRIVFLTAKIKANNIADAAEAVKAAEAKRDWYKAEFGKKVDDWRSGEVLCLPALPGNFRVGDIGTASGSVDVLQIVDESNMLVSGNVGSATTIDPDSPERVSFTKPRTVWLQGVSTKELADGVSVKIAGDLFEVTGNKTYDSASGVARTVFVLQPYKIDLEEARALWKSRAKKKPD